MDVGDLEGKCPWGHKELDTTEQRHLGLLRITVCMC